MAVDVSIWEKIKKLKDAFSDGDESARQQIAEWEKRIQVLSRMQDFMQNEAAQELIKILKSRIKGHMKYRLQAGLTDASRVLSDAKEAECRWMLSLFSPGYESELESLESILDAELV